MGPEWIVIVVFLVMVILVAATGRRSSGGGGSTAGHYDPDAIGGYTLDPATMRYRYDLPTLPRSAVGTGRSAAPPLRRRRRRRRPPDGTG